MQRKMEMKVCSQDRQGQAASAGVLMGLVEVVWREWDLNWLGYGQRLETGRENEWGRGIEGIEGEMILSS